DWRPRSDHGRARSAGGPLSDQSQVIPSDGSPTVKAIHGADIAGDEFVRFIRQQIDVLVGLRDLGMATDHCRKLFKAVRLFSLDISKRPSDLLDVGFEVSVQLLTDDEVEDRE